MYILLHIQVNKIHISNPLKYSTPENKLLKLFSTVPEIVFVGHTKNCLRDFMLTISFLTTSNNDYAGKKVMFLLHQLPTI